MDSLGWDHHSQVLTNSESLWRNQQPDSVDLADDIFNQIQDLQMTQTSQQMNPDTERHKEATRLAANSELPASGAGTSCNWGDAKFCSYLINKPFATTCCMSEFCMISDQSRIINGLQLDSMAATVSTGSLDSLDCLLSATISSTDTSVEDDGVSMIFSDCRNLWNFTAQSSAVAVSSGESENNTCNPRNKKLRCCSVSSSAHCETLSQCSSGRQAGNCSQTKPASTKRSNDHRELKVGQKHPFFDLLRGDCSIKVGFRLISERPPKSVHPNSSNINFQQQPSSSSVCCTIEEPDAEAIAQMKEMIYRAAAFRPVNLGLEVVEKPKRKNVRISNDPQTVAARQRRQRISERIRVLQRLVPGGSKMDTASMLDEAANYLKFLRSQVKALENLRHKLDYSVNCPHATTNNITFSSPPFNNSFPTQNHLPAVQIDPIAYHIHHPQS